MSWNLSTGLQKALLGKTGTFGSVAELFTDSVIEIFEGVRPINGADEDEGETAIIRITLDGGAFTPGLAPNGLNLGEFVGAVLKKALGETWKGAGISDGTAKWGRWYSNAMVTGPSTTAIRMDGVVATSGGDINMANGTSIITGVDSEVTEVSITMEGV